ncbi:MAG: hypothetical protein JWO08_1182 [Verrucomicrobiaceae bacterium]|nr:hypothetical protein [Verrucomicrobiaceae bacterium]
MPKAEPYNPIDSARINQIAAALVEMIPRKLAEGEEQMRQDYAQAVEEAHLNEADKLPKLKFAFAITYTPASKLTDVDLKWSVTRTLSESVVLEDPDQSKLKL